MRTPRKAALAVVLAPLVLVLSSAAAGAATLQVDDDLADCSMAGFTTIGMAVAAASPMDTVEVCPGTYAEAPIVIDKALTIDGLDRDTTFVEPTGTYAFRVESGGFTLSDLTLRPGSGTEGVRFELVAATLSGHRIDNVVFSGFSSRAIEIHGDITIEDLTITDSVFVDNATGIRISSTSHVDGLHVSGTSFTSAAGGAIGIYEANDGGTSTLTDLQVTECSFTDLGLAGLFLEEVTDSVIEDNEFTGNHTGVLVFKNYASSGVPVSGLQILDNHFTDHTRRSIWIWSLLQPLGAGVRIAGNEIDQDVGALASDGQGSIQLHLANGLAHQQVEIAMNSVTFSGAFSTATTAFGVHLDGDGPVLVEQNTFDGGGVAAGGGTPPFAGIYIQSDSATMGPRTDPVDVVCSDLLRFAHGVTVYDPVAGMPGGLQPGVEVTVETSNIVGNSAYGIFDGGASETIDAPDDWWGAPNGPSGEGPGSGDAISENVSVPTFAPSVLVDCAPVPVTPIVEVPATGTTGLLALALLLGLAGAFTVTRLGG